MSGRPPRPIAPHAGGRRWDTSDRGASLLFVLTVVMVLSVATLGVTKIGFATSKSDAASEQELRYVNALDTAAAAGLDTVRSHGNACEPQRSGAQAEGTEPAGRTWPLRLDDVDGLAAKSAAAQAADTGVGEPASTVAPIRVEVTCETVGDQLLLTATRMMECPTGIAAPASRLTLTLRAATVGEADTSSLQLLARNVTDVATGCAAP